MIRLLIAKTKRKLIFKQEIKIYNGKIIQI